MAADLVVVGGGLGGCAAAWAALRRGLRVVLTEEGPWIGGQMTSQAVPPDEHPWIEQFGCTRSYRRLRQEIRRYYRRFYPLTAAARAHPALNPGNGFVSRLCHEPRVSLAVLQAILAPYQAGGRLALLTGYRAVACEMEGDRCRAVLLQDVEGEARMAVQAPYFVDATETGELLPLAGVEYVTGAEARAETGEPHAADQAQPLNMQAVSWCFVVDYRPGEDHTIERPATYEFWRNYVPPMRPPWPGPFLSWAATHPVTLETVVRHFDPLHPDPARGPMDLWTFRRIADRTNFEPGAYESDVVLVNRPQID
ncbi:MAG TPA: FAD-dependent oxidoreductase, partial [Candidatus Nitrosotenuis sp.]|nr:FAD-dependent oxidoreductase [Candidatus Nitrosotenuis sp.]